MDDQERRVETTSRTYRADENPNRSRKWLWILLPLLLLGLLLFFLLDSMNDKEGDTRTTDQANTSEQGTANTEQTTGFDELQSQFNSQFAADERTIYFTADSVELEDETEAMTKVDALAAFAQSNPEAKLQVNGSIFDGDEADSTSNLAKQRAELVKDMLVEKGVRENMITVSTKNNYEGQDEAARAKYARSVTVSVVR